jgi:hypothetical protein
MVVHHIPPLPLPENLWTLIALYVAFTFFVSTTPSFHFVSKKFLETELGEALNDKIYLKSDCGTQLVNPGAQNWEENKKSYCQQFPYNRNVLAEPRCSVEHIMSVTDRREHCD